MTFAKAIFAATTIILFSCCGTQKTSEQSSTMNQDIVEASNSKEVATKMMEAGMMRGTIVASEVENDCPFTIRIADKTGTLLDPINLDPSFHVSGMKVWFSFRPLRMMNRCDKANPVELSDIQTRIE